MRVSEIYQSVQGEGPRVGTPTTFVRFGGCNLRCPAWPCDTPFAIDPEKHRNEWTKQTPEEVAEKIPTYPRNVCLTGGEPMIQRHTDIERLIKILRERDQNVEMFTNGTIKYTPFIFTNCFLIMDWKLPGSGEKDNQWGLLNENRFYNLKGLSPLDVVKFTIADYNDFDHAYDIWNRHILPIDDAYQPMVYVGIVWGKDLTDAKLVDVLLQEELPWKLNVQVHNHIWDRSQRGI